MSLWRQQPAMDTWSALLLAFVCAGNEQLGADVRLAAETLLPSFITPLRYEADHGQDAWACILLACCYGWSKGVGNHCHSAICVICIHATYTIAWCHVLLCCVGLMS